MLNFNLRIFSIPNVQMFEHPHNGYLYCTNLYAYNDNCKYVDNVAERYICHNKSSNLIIILGVKYVNEN